MSGTTGSRPSSERAYVNCHAYTVDSRSPWAEAFIVAADGTFCHVGTTEEIRSLATEGNVPIVDLEKRFIMPGIHDAHLHILSAAFAATAQGRIPPMGINSANVAAEMKKGGCVCKYAHIHDDWLIANGFLVEDYDREALDKEYPDTPVLIRGGAQHTAYLNTAALERACYDLDHEIDGQAKKFVRDANGRLTGEVRGGGMSKAILSVPKPGLEQLKKITKEVQAMLHRAGVTSCQEASSSNLVLKVLEALEADGDLKLDMATHIVYAPDWIGEEPLEALHALLDQADRHRSTHLDTRFVKIILDGVPLPPLFTHAGLKDDGSVEDHKLTIDNIHEAVQRYDQRGMTVKVHCTGHGATRLTLDAFEAARQQNPNGPRHEIAHCSGVPDDDYHRFRALNVTAEMSPAPLFRHPVTLASGGLMDWNFEKMMDAGAHMTIGSDWSIEAKPDLLPDMVPIVESVGNGDRQLGGQRLCRMLTLAGAEAVGKDKIRGSIEVGKKANFIAVDKDLSKGDFKGASVVTTWFEGEIVYQQ